MIHFTKKDPAAVELGRKGGLKGGKARAAKLSPEKRTEIAIKAAKARWAEKPSSKQARNIYELLKQTGPLPPAEIALILGYKQTTVTPLLCRYVRQNRFFKRVAVGWYDVT